MKAKGLAVNLVPCDCGMFGRSCWRDLCDPKQETRWPQGWLAWHAGEALNSRKGRSHRAPSAKAHQVAYSLKIASLPVRFIDILSLSLAGQGRGFDGPRCALTTTPQPHQPQR